jgi:hypothetical protein
MGRDPRIFRGAKQSWVGTHGSFVARNGHGSGPTDLSWRETAMGQDPRSIVVRNSHGSGPTVNSRRERATGPALSTKTRLLGIFFNDLRHSPYETFRNRPGASPLLLSIDPARLVPHTSVSADPAVFICSVEASNSLRKTSASFPRRPARRLAVWRLAADVWESITYAGTYQAFHCRDDLAWRSGSRYPQAGR